MPDRTAQVTDEVVLELRFPHVEEWVADVLGQCEEYEVTTDDREDLIVQTTVLGNCNAIANAASFLRDVEDLLQEANSDPMGFTLIARALPPATDR